MIISWPVEYIDKTEQTSEIVKRNGRQETVATFKRCQRNLYINTDTLTPRDKLWVDIAQECQKIVGDSRYFIMLRNLFKEGDWTKIKHDAVEHVMTAGWYFENSSGEQISTAQFFAEWRGLPETVELPNRRLVPANLSEDQARALGIPELVPLRHTDFNFTKQDIDILNRFVECAYDLCNASLCRQQQALILHFDRGAFSLEKNITQEQYLASLIIFRKLYSDNEPAGFKRAVKILQNTKKVNHPLVSAVNQANRQYNDLLVQKIVDDPYMGPCIKGILVGSWSPSGKELIQALFNVNSIHQGDKTIQLEQKIRNAISSQAVVSFSLWSLLGQLCAPISTVAKYAKNALLSLDSLTVTPKAPDITNKELEFKFFLTKKVPELAEIIWHEHGCPKTGVVRYCRDAERQIIEKFNLPQDYFSNMNIVRK